MCCPRQSSVRKIKVASNLNHSVPSGNVCSNIFSITPSIDWLLAWTRAAVCSIVMRQCVQSLILQSTFYGIFPVKQFSCFSFSKLVINMMSSNSLTVLTLASERRVRINTMFVSSDNRAGPPPARSSIFFNLLK